MFPLRSDKRRNGDGGSQDLTYAELGRLAADAANLIGERNYDAADGMLADALGAISASEALTPVQALRHADAIMIDGMALTCRGARQHAGRQDSGLTTEMATARLIEIDGAWQRGDAADARQAFAVLAGEVLHSDAVSVFLPDRLPAAVSHVVRGWCSGLALLLGTQFKAEDERRTHEEGD